MPNRSWSLSIPTDQEATLRECEKLNAGEDTISFENRYQCKDGSYKWLLWSSTASPEQQRYYAVARDITGRKQQTEALAASQERFALAVQGSSDGIWDWKRADKRRLLFAAHEGIDRLQRSRD